MVFPRQAAKGREAPIGDTPAHERQIQVVCRHQAISRHHTSHRDFQTLPNDVRPASPDRSAYSSWPTLLAVHVGAKPSDVRCGVKCGRRAALENAKGGIGDDRGLDG